MDGWYNQVKKSSSSKLYTVVIDALVKNQSSQFIRFKCNPNADHDPQTSGADYKDFAHINIFQMNKN